MPMEIPKIEETKRTAEVNLLLEFIEKILIKLEEQIELNAILKEEINRLKNHKGKPKIKPSNMEPKKDRNNNNKNNDGFGGPTGTPPKAEEIIVKATEIPKGARFKGYQDYEVQEIILGSKVVKYRLERWKLANGEYVVAKLPEEISGYHFGPKLRSYIIYQNNIGVTEAQILEQLKAWGIKISSGELNRLLIENKENFHKEKEEILEAGIRASTYINVDDTGARHAGKNGYCTHIGNELFAWFSSTGSKSRINFLELLRHGYGDYVIGENALAYMKKEKLPREQMELLRKQAKTFSNKNEFKKHLQDLGIETERLVKIITEGALVGSILEHGFPADFKIISDDAGQFNIFQHALCWIHAERGINRLIPLNEKHAKDIETILEKFWKLYKTIKEYKISPTIKKVEEITKDFDDLCKIKTSYCLLNNALKRLGKNKKELLLVLKYPEIPLHNNLSENDIREYVKRRKISGGTRSELGRKYRDTFISLKKTCRKLKINFWEYLLDRNNKTNKIPYLPTLIRQVATANTG